MGIEVQSKIHWFHPTQSVDNGSHYHFKIPFPYSRVQFQKEAIGMKSSCQYSTHEVGGTNAFGSIICLASSNRLINSAIVN